MKKALDALSVYLKPRVLIVLFLGFSSGLPLALSGATLLVWMRESGVDLGTIGLFALVGTPYTVKFLWAPLTDAIDVPLLSRWLGRRRGWLVFTQMLLMAAIVFLGSTNPAQAPAMVALGALLVAAASATQDSWSTPSASRACRRMNKPPAWPLTWRPIASACWFRPLARCSWSAPFKAMASTSRPRGTGAIWRWRCWC